VWQQPGLFLTAAVLRNLSGKMFVLAVLPAKILLYFCLQQLHSCLPCSSQLVIMFA
jgi:hypothetical protein